MQPTARSTSLSLRCTGTAPAEWLRSHRTSAPASLRHLRDLVHVGDLGGAIGDVAERDQRDVVGVEQRLELFGLRAGARIRLQPFDPAARLGREPLEDVAVSREVVGVSDDRAAPGACCECRGGELVEADRGGVGDQRRAGRGAEQLLPEPVADRLRQLHPGLVPAADQPLVPLVGQQPFEFLSGLSRRASERIAVEVDQPVGDRFEAVQERRQRIVGVELFSVVSAGCHSVLWFASCTVSERVKPVIYSRSMAPENEPDPLIAPRGDDSDVSDAGGACRRAARRGGVKRAFA